MEAFKDAWLAIDTNRKGWISSAELTEYMQKQNYDDAFVTKWMKLFDQDNSGTIEIDEYCDVLGLNPRQLLGENKLPDGVVYISGDMELSWQIKVAELCLEGLRTQQHMKDVPKFVKNQADARWEKLWHCVIVNGQFWCYYGYQPGYSFVFRYGKQVFIVFKTPKL